MGRHTAFISVGSNMGDRLVNCRNGIAGLAELESVEITATSRFYQTEPVDFKDQDWFVNAVVRISTTLPPEKLLNSLKRIEEAVGSSKTVRFGPRMLDLDIVLYDDLVFNSPRLILPHPRMHKRRFVLAPICDIEPKIVHPVLRIELQELLQGLDETGQRIIPFRCVS